MCASSVRLASKGPARVVPQAPDNKGMSPRGVGPPDSNEAAGGRCFYQVCVALTLML